MLIIKFFADSDLEDFESAVKEYEDIWQTDGEKIIQGWEKITGLEFRETFINALVFNGISASHPLSLRFNLPIDRKKSALVHELGHRILYGRRKEKTDSLERHKFLNLVLYDLFTELYGEQFAKETVEWDSNLTEMYKEAWDWALNFNKEERKQKFRETLNS